MSELTNLQHQPALRRLRFWPAVLAFLLAAQIALLVHQFGHSRNLEAVDAATECALCSVAAAMVSPPDASVVVVPLFLAALVVYAPRASTIVLRQAPQPFQARGPPSILSV